MRILRFWPPLLHLAVLVILIPLTVWQWQLVPEVVRPETASIAAGDVPGDPATVKPTEARVVPDRSEDLTEISTRPLFRQGRQILAADPEEPTRDRPEREPARRETLRMVGYVASNSGPVAIIYVPNENMQYVVRQDDEIGGMKVISIERDHVLLAYAGEEIRIELSGK